MSQEPHTLSFANVVLIADVLRRESQSPADRRRDLEKTDPSTLSDIVGAISKLGVGVHHYEHPRDLAERAELHKNDIVLSIFGGTVSRNRMALVPAICEALGLRYVGPDTYGRIMCQDKEVSKSIAREAGLTVPTHRIVRERSDIERITDFPLPYVCKPLWEGSSIGIGPHSLVRDIREGPKVVERQLSEFQQPLLIEAFVPGREVSWCFIEQSNKRLRGLGEVVWQGDTNHFDHYLYDAQHKLVAEGNKTVRTIDAELQPDDAHALEKLLRMVGPIGYGRVDGKLRNGRFVFLEITPDAWLGPTGTFATVFTSQGLSYEEVLEQLLLSARPGPRAR